MQKLLILGLVTVTMAHATVLWVNDDAAGYTPPGQDCTVSGYVTIQAAVNAAAPGDTIRVCPGFYVENITIDKSSLTVVSTDGSPATIVRSATASTDVFFVTQPNVTIDGFTIVPAGPSG